MEKGGEGARDKQGDEKYMVQDSEELANGQQELGTEMQGSSGGTMMTMFSALEKTADVAWSQREQTLFSC